MAVRVQEVVIDCAVPAELAAFWGTIFGARWAAMGEGWAVVESEPVRLAFQQVPEAKVVKNRLHLDLKVEDIEEATRVALELGARIVTPLQGRSRAGFAVLSDPAGNEFCFVADEDGAWEADQLAALDAASHHQPVTGADQPIG